MPSRARVEILTAFFEPFFAYRHVCGAPSRIRLRAAQRNVGGIRSGRRRAIGLAPNAVLERTRYRMATLSESGDAAVVPLARWPIDGQD